ncbi:MAG: hypothetical protein ABJB21_10480 [bacterium]
MNKLRTRCGTASVATGCFGQPNVIEAFGGIQHWMPTSGRSNGEYH